MCRNIRPLFNFDPPATKEEVREASLQFVRKLSGFNKPSLENQKVFDDSIDKISLIVEDLMDSLVTKSAPKDRKEEEVKAKVRAKKRYGVS